MNTNTNDMVCVRFLRNDLPYLKGELAGFPRAQAERLIKLGFAEQHGDGKPVRIGGRVPEPIDSGYWSPPEVIAAARKA